MSGFEVAWAIGAVVALFVVGWLSGRFDLGHDNLERLLTAGVVAAFWPLALAVALVAGVFMLGRKAGAAE